MKTRQDRGARPGRDGYRTLTSASVLIVAAIAATVSFLHISHLALKYGQVPLAAYLMPISVDGVVTVSSLVLLRSARAGSSSSVWARTGLILGVLATLAANVTSGIAYGPIGAVVAGWPAIAFVVSAETVIGMVRRKPAKVAPPAPIPDPPTTPEPDSTDIRDNPGGRLGRMLDQETRALTALSAEPDMGYPELAATLGVSESTARRVKARLNGRTPMVEA